MTFHPVALENDEGIKQMSDRLNALGKTKYAKLIFTILKSDRGQEE